MDSGQHSGQLSSSLPRHATNDLRIESLPGGTYRLIGYALGERVRKRSRSLPKLTAIRKGYEQRIQEFQGHVVEELTPAQIQDARAAIQVADGRPLLDWIVAAKRVGVFPPSKPVTSAAALTAWLGALSDRKRSARTTDKNKRRVEAFVKGCGAKTIADITPAALEQWIYRKGQADYTRLTDAQVLRAWLNFCVQRRWLSSSPFQVDMKDMTATARPVESGRILSPAQCHAYLAAARAYRGGLMVPYVILTTWCFMRESEAKRTTKAAMKLDRSEPVILVDTVKRGTAKKRTVSIPANVLPLLREAVKDWKDDKAIPFSRSSWTTIREKAGLLTRGKTTRHKRRPILESDWQTDIARHSGYSYFFQQSGDITETARQAGNSPDVGFRHYLTLAEEGDAAKFYAAT